jgi:hypothetical protein
MSTLYEDFARDSTGHDWPLLERAMTFLSERTAAADYQRFSLMLHAAMNRGVAVRMHEEDAAAAEAARVAAEERAQRKQVDNSRNPLKPN